MPVRSVASLLVRSVHVRPSALVASLPRAPTATHTPSAYATLAMSELPKPLVWSVQETPSGLVRSVPRAPTATHRAPPNVTPARFGVPRGLPVGPIEAVAVALEFGLALA